MEAVDAAIKRHERRLARWARRADVRGWLFGLRASPPLSAESQWRRRALVVGAVGVVVAQVVMCIAARVFDVWPGPRVASSYVMAIAVGASLMVPLMLVAVPVRAAGASRFERVMPFFMRASACGLILAPALGYVADHVVPWYAAPRYDVYAVIAFVGGHLAVVLLFDQIACIAARMPDGGGLLVVAAKAVAYAAIVAGPVIFVLPVATFGPTLAAAGLVPPAVLLRFAARVWAGLRSPSGG